MFAKLFNGNFTVPQMAIFIMAVILIILSLVIALNCYVECCCRGANDLQKYEEDDQQFFDKGNHIGVEIPRLFNLSHIFYFFRHPI